MRSIHVWMIYEMYFHLHTRQRCASTSFSKSAPIINLNDGRSVTVRWGLSTVGSKMLCSAMTGHSTPAISRSRVWCVACCTLRACVCGFNVYPSFFPPSSHSFFYSFFLFFFFSSFLVEVSKLTRMSFLSCSPHARGRRNGLVEKPTIALSL
jgi:hypothetical protein